MSTLHISPENLPLVAIALTLGAYLVGLKARDRWNTPLANPVLIAIVFIGLLLRLLNIAYADYFSGAQFIHFLLGPATVALAIPLVNSLAHIRRVLWPMIAALGCGALTGVVTGYGLVRFFGGSQLLALSMAPKSATTPIAIGVSQAIGGIPALAAVFAISGGILVAIVINPMLSRLGWDEPAVLGLAAGTAGSGIGASQVIPQHSVAAAFAGVAIGINGAMTAILAPLLTTAIKLWYKG